jgi:hypothetical protein
MSTNFEKGMRMRNTRFFRLPFAVIVAMSGLLFSEGFSAAQEAARTEIAFEEEMIRAEAFFERGAYKEAAESYLKAAALTTSPMSKSRAYLGLSLSAYYQQDLSGTRFWLGKILEVDPNKEISALFYPAAFVRMFQEVRDEAGSAGPVRSTPSLAAEQPAVEPEDPSIQAGSPPRTQRTFFSFSEWRDRLEIEVHVSSWSLNPILNMVSETLSDEVGKVVRDEIRREVRRKRPDLQPAFDESDVVIGSSGSNTGFGFRIYPRGRSGAFSVGFSLEKTVMKATVDGAVTQVFSNGSRAVVDAQAYVEMRPWSTHMNFRWDFLPSRRISPLIVLGLGLARLDGIVGYSYTGTYFWEGPEETIGESDEKDFKTAEEEIGDSIPNILPFVQACLGLRAELYRGLSLRAEAGFWNGIIFRGGLSYRF